MLRRVDGANLYSSSADIAYNWTLAGVSLGALSSGRRSGCRSFYFTGLTALQQIFDAQSTWIVGGAYMRATSADFKIAIGTSAGEQISVRVDPTTGQLYVSRNGTVLWDSGGDARYRMVPGVYRYIEFKATIGASGSWTLRVDGLASSEVSGSSVNTAGQGGSTADRVTYNCISSTTVNLADMYICDGTGGTDNDFLGDLRVDPIFPNANGTNDQWLKSTGTDAYTVVDENPPNDDTDYLYSNTLNDLTTVGMQDLPYSPSIVHAIHIGIHARKTDSGPRGITPAIRTNANNYLDATELPLQTAYQILPTSLFVLNPNTGVRFTESEVNAIEIGAKLTS